MQDKTAENYSVEMDFIVPCMKCGFDCFTGLCSQCLDVMHESEAIVMYDKYEKEKERTE